MTDALTVSQPQGIGWQMVEGKRSKQHHAWSRLQRNLARTLEDLYMICEADWHADLVESAVRYLEQSVNDFKQAAQCLQHIDKAELEAHCQQQPQKRKPQQPEQHATLVGPNTPDASSGRQHFVSDSLPSRLCKSSNLAGLQQSGGTQEAGLGDTAAAEYLLQQQAEACSSDVSIADDSFSSCSSSSNSSCFSSCHGSKGSTASSTSSGAAWQGRMNWSKVFDAPGVSVNGLHHKLSSPDRLRKSPSQTKAAAEERQARAERLRTALAEEKLARLKQEQLAKQQKRKKDDAVAAAARSADKHQRSEVLRAAHISRIKAKALDETRKVEEVTFINTLNNAGKKADLQQRLEEGEARRAEALAAILAKQQGAAASVKEAAERRRQAEAERLAQLAERQRRKQEAQAKIEEERRVAAAAREAAKAAARAVTQQREAARQQHAALLASKTNARLKQAAQRRLKHLEMIRERAALGKDLERRDSFGLASMTSRSPSPTAQLGKLQQPQQPGRPPLVPALKTPPAAAAAASLGSTTSVPAVKASKLNAAAPVFCPTGAAVNSIMGSAGGSVKLQCVAGGALETDSTMQQPATSSQLSFSETASITSSREQCSSTRGSSPLPPVPAAVAPLPAVVLQQLKGNSQSVEEAGITPAGNLKNSIKGARRRMAKCRRKLLEPGTGSFSEPETALQLTCSPQAQELLATWAPHLALLNVQPPQLRSMQQTAGQAAAAGPLQPGSATNSSSCSTPDRAAQSSFSGSGSNTPEQLCNSGSVQAAYNRLAITERRDALVALVNSARANLSKQPLVVCHLARQTGLLHLLCKEVLSAAGGAAQRSCDAAAADTGAGTGQHISSCNQARIKQDKLQEAHMLELLVRLLELPTNLDYLLGSGPLLPGFAKAMLAALDHCNSLEADEPAMMTGGEAASRLSVLLQVLVAVLEHPADSAECIEMQEELVGFMVAAGTVGRLANVFSLFDQPVKDAAKPVPPHVLQCLRLLRGLTAVRRPNMELLAGKRWPTVNSNAAAIIMDLQATAVAGVLSLLTAVLLNASPTCTPAEASSKALPPNFVEAAHLVMSVLNNVCRLDLLAAQHMLGCAHNRLEFFHLISFLLSYCSSRWPAAAPTVPTVQSTSQQIQQQPPKQRAADAGAGAVEQSAADGAAADVRSSTAVGSNSKAASSSSIRPNVPEVSRMRAAVGAIVHHPIAELLNQVLLLIGYFCVQHSSNQAILQWGRCPTILQRLCSMPFQYFVVPELKAVAMPTLLSVCYGADRTCELVSQHVSLQMLLQHVQQERQLQSQQLLEGGSSQQHQPQQQDANQQQIPGEVRNLLQRLTGPPTNGGARVSISGGRANSNCSAGSAVSSSSLAQFQLAKRFPLSALQDVEQYLQQQLQGKQDQRCKQQR